jgi:hypothetical protein
VGVEKVPELENDLVVEALAWLQARLPTNWKVELSQQTNQAGRRLDGIINIQASQSAATVILEVKSRLEPREAASLFSSGTVQRMRDLTNYQILIVSRWLSQQTRDVLIKNNLSFLDLTGNSRIVLEYPTLFIESQGASKDPDPLPKGRVRLQGPKAGRLIRTIADFEPPYGVVQLAGATSLAQSYVSRVLDLLDDEAIIERASRGGVESVDVGALVRRWTMTYDVFKSNQRFPFLAPQGAQLALGQIGESTSRYAVTGSFSAYRVESVTVPSMLMAYTDEPENIANQLGWLPTDQGANVMLLRPFDPVVWRSMTSEKNITYAAYSQTAADCMTGNGRMPQEGEALLKWMTDRVPAWRNSELPSSFES